MVMQYWTRGSLKVTVILGSQWFRSRRQTTVETLPLVFFIVPQPRDPKHKACLNSSSRRVTENTETLRKVGLNMARSCSSLDPQNCVDHPQLQLKNSTSIITTAILDMARVACTTSISCPKPTALKAFCSCLLSLSAKSKGDYWVKKKQSDVGLLPGALMAEVLSCRLQNLNIQTCQECQSECPHASGRAYLENEVSESRTRGKPPTARHLHKNSHGFQ